MIVINQVDDAIARIQVNVRMLVEHYQVNPQDITDYIWRVARLCLVNEGLTPEQAGDELIALTQRLNKPINALLWQCDSKALAAIDRMLDKQVKEKEREKSKFAANDGCRPGGAV